MDRTRALAVTGLVRRLVSHAHEGCVQLDTRRVDQLACELIGVALAHHFPWWDWVAKCAFVSGLLGSMIGSEANRS